MPDSHPRTKAIGFTAVLTLVAASAMPGWLGCERTAKEAGNPAAEADPPAIGEPGLNIIFISVDTTRADHLGCYGHPIVKTPNIDRFAAEGTRFAWCISAAPLTLPSHTTMLTGSYPFLHGARDNGIFTVADENVTLAEIFKEAGYATHAEVAALVLNHNTGLNQGFDTYGDVEAVVPGKRRSSPQPPDTQLEGSDAPAITPEPPPAVEVERKADEIFGRGIELLTAKAKTQERFFMFLHCFDPHWPQEAPERFSSQYEDGYYGEIAFFDEQFGKLIDALRDLGLADKTVVLLTSDHGEGRGQHGEYTHSTYLYDTTLHVPLIMWGPGHVPAKQVVQCQVRTVDLAPTVLELAGLADRRTEQMQGISLVPFLLDPALDLRLPCYSDTMVPKTSYGYSPLRSLRVGDRKYILAPQPEMYAYPEDRLELFNLVNVEPDRAMEMRQELYDLIADSPDPPGGRGVFRSLSEADLRKMEALGYISSKLDQDPDLATGREIDFFEPKGVNPKDRIESIESMAMGLGAMRIGEYEHAERFFRRFVELEPDSADGVSLLARALTRLDQDDEAIEMFRKCVELEPDRSLEHRLLGDLLAFKRRYAEAAEAHQRAVQANPEDHLSRIHFGRVLAARGSYDEALEQYDAAIELVPDQAEPRLQKGLTLLLANRPAEAIPLFDETVRLDPLRVRAYTSKAQALRQLGRIDEAIEVLSAAIESLPEKGVLYHGLAECYAVQRDWDRVEANFRRVVKLLPKSEIARKNLGLQLLAFGKTDQAIEQLRKAVELDPEYTGAHFQLGKSLAAKGESAAALASYRTVLELSPRHAVAFRAVADLLDELGQPVEALAVLRGAVENMPQNASLANDLAWRLATSSVQEIRNGAEAVQYAEAAERLTGSRDINMLDTLAAAYAAAGRFEDAVATADRAVDAAREAHLEDAATRILTRRALYKERQPYRVP
ncbi:MAG: sulfatase-like hydrolase/transferase [Planctomycetes bacterium]|nr:sulfatase-like hydrolase/transferase [Planctomycetota bacterium]